MNIEDWKLSKGSEILAQVLSCLPGLEQTKNVTKALDGSVYIQTIGRPNTYVALTIFASRDKMHSINQAEADNTLLTAVYREKRYSGYIEEPPSWNPVELGAWYAADIKLLIETEVFI